MRHPFGLHLNKVFRLQQVILKASTISSYIRYGDTKIRLFPKETGNDCSNFI